MPDGKLKDIAALGLMAGKSIAAQREIEYTRAKSRELQRIQHEKEMAKFRAQMDLEAAMQAHRWELEKMQVRSRLDFERQERERMRKLDDIDNALRQIDREVEAGRISEKQANVLRFNQEMKRYGAAPPVSLIRPPTPERPRYVTPSQQMAAYRLLQGEEFEEPSWYEKPFGLGKLTEEELFYKEMLERIARGEPTAPGIPAGTISTGLPIVRNDADFDALPSGAEFIDPQGNKRRKP